jgi:hypothetical protein
MYLQPWKFFSNALFAVPNFHQQISLHGCIILLKKVGVDCSSPSVLLRSLYEKVQKEGGKDIACTRFCRMKPVREVASKILLGMILQKSFLSKTH